MLGSAARQRIPRFGIAPRRRPGKIYGRIGSLEVRLAQTWADIRCAQRLRYDVFYNEMSARANFTTQLRGRDEDPYDAICDHLLVVDTSLPCATGRDWRRQKPHVVGTYRVLRQEIAERKLGFYTQGEYDIAQLIARRPDLRFMELGRSCVLKPYRNKRTVELLWHAVDLCPRAQG